MGLELPFEAWLDRELRKRLPAKTVSWSRRPEKAAAVQRWMRRAGWTVHFGKNYNELRLRGAAVAVWHPAPSVLVSAKEKGKR